MGELHDRLEEIAHDLSGHANLLEFVPPAYKEDLASWLDTNVKMATLFIADDPVACIKAISLACFTVGHNYALKHGDIRAKS